MERCQCCGRYPAKRIRATTRRGFALFARRVEIDGRYCRDCAQAAYFAADSSAWHGSPPFLRSSRLPSRRSSWDTGRLGDLPPEVMDGPWVRHLISCPYCRATFFSLAGPATCVRCAGRFVVGSCAHCGVAHVIATAGAATAASIAECRVCRRFGSSVARPQLAHAPRRPSPGRGGRGRGRREPDGQLGGSCALPQNSRRIQRVLAGGRSLAGRILPALCPRRIGGRVGRLPRALQWRFKREALSIAIALAEIDGPLTTARRQTLRQLARKLGLDLDAEFHKLHAEDDASPPTHSIGWWTILQVPRDASLGEIEAGYRTRGAAASSRSAVFRAGAPAESGRRSHEKDQRSVCRSQAGGRGGPSRGERNRAHEP